MSAESQHVQAIRDEVVWKGWPDIELPLPMMSAIYELGFERPSSIQEVALPVIAEGRNLICEAPSGTGKTAAYAIGTLAQVNPENNVPQVLILVHTRKLVQQTSNVVSNLGTHLNIVITTLEQDWIGPPGHVLVGTPAATRDAIAHGKIKVDQIRRMVLDDAVLLLNQDHQMGSQVNLIRRCLPRDLQCLFFAKRFHDECRKFMNQIIPEAVKIAVRHGKLMVWKDDDGEAWIESGQVPRVGETHCEPAPSGGGDVASGGAIVKWRMVFNDIPYFNYDAFHSRDLVPIVVRESPSFKSKEVMTMKLTYGDIIGTLKSDGVVKDSRPGPTPGVVSWIPIRIGGVARWVTCAVRDGVGKEVYTIFERAPDNAVLTKAMEKTETGSQLPQHEHQSARDCLTPNAPQPYPVSALRADAPPFIPGPTMQRTHVARSSTLTFKAELHPVPYSEDAVVYSRLCRALGFPESFQDERMKPMSGLIESMQRALDASASSESTREYQRNPRLRPKVVAVHQNRNKALFKSFSHSVAQMEESVRNGKRVEALNLPIEDSALEACPFNLDSFHQLNCVPAFHGVQWSKCEDLLKNGFDEAFAMNGLYGNMCYSAPQSNKAMQYARADGCSVRKSKCGKHKPLIFCNCSQATNSDGMIRQRLIYGPVLLGNPYYAKGVTGTSGGKTEECGLRKPPEGYDSIVANPDIWRSDYHQQVHQEFIFRNHNGAYAYPAYVVEVEYSHA